MSDFGGYLTENVEAWIQECILTLHFDAQRSAYANDPMALIKPALKAEAWIWFYDQKPEEINTPERLFHSIRQQFRPIQDQAELEKDFRKCSQESNKPIAQFERRLCQAAQK